MNVIFTKWRKRVLCQPVVDTAVILRSGVIEVKACHVLQPNLCTIKALTANINLLVLDWILWQKIAHDQRRTVEHVSTHFVLLLKYHLTFYDHPFLLWMRSSILWWDLSTGRPGSSRSSSLTELSDFDQKRLHRTSPSSSQVILQRESHATLFFPEEELVENCQC